MFCAVSLFVIIFHVLVHVFLARVLIFIQVCGMLRFFLCVWNPLWHTFPLSTYSTHKLVICNLNVRDTSNTLKRCEVFRWLRMNTYAVSLLQEVHYNKDKETLWTAKCGYPAMFSGFSSCSVGSGYVAAKVRWQVKSIFTLKKKG